MIDVVLHAGRSAVELALYTLLPVMVLTMIALRLLEAYGILDRFITALAPFAKPFGLVGLGVLAMLQISFVSFVAPLPTLTLMEDRGVSDRRLGASLAAVLAMAPANAVFPLAALGLHVGTTLVMSVAGGLLAASSTYWLFGRRLSDAQHAVTEVEAATIAIRSPLRIINLGGAEAIQIVINIIPMLLLSLVLVFGLQRAGVVDAFIGLASPSFASIGLDQTLIVPTLTKYLAGSTALLGVLTELSKQGQASPSLINHASGFLLHPLDAAGVAILISAGARVGSTLLPALGGACLGIAFRTVGTVVLA